MRVMSRTAARLSSICAAALVFCSLSAKANVITVINGSFESVSVAGASNQLGYHTNGTSNIQNVTGWTNGTANGYNGYSFVFINPTETGSTYGSAYGDAGNISLWGVENNASNGIGPSPDGGNFLAMDGAHDAAPLSQTLSGLTVGALTQVSFWYAGAQQSGFDGTTYEAFKVGLSDGTTTQYQSTPTLTDDSHGFTGWHYETLSFTATSTSETLSFLAVGSPSGYPPFSLLDGVSVVQVTPEPSSLALLGTGVLAVGGLLRRRKAVRS